MPFFLAYSDVRTSKNKKKNRRRKDQATSSSNNEPGGNKVDPKQILCVCILLSSTFILPGDISLVSLYFRIIVSFPTSWIETLMGCLLQEELLIHMTLGLLYLHLSLNLMMATLMMNLTLQGRRKSIGMMVLLTFVFDLGILGVEYIC